MTKAGKTSKAMTSLKSTMVTCIGANYVNAISKSTPPFLIFKGKRQNDDIKQGRNTWLRVCPFRKLGPFQRLHSTTFSEICPVAL